MRAALRTSVLAAVLLSLLWTGAAVAQGPSMDEVESARGSAVEAFVTDRARGDWRAELPTSCGSTAKTDLSALICELRFREAQFATTSWSASATPGGVTNDDCARVSMLEEIRAAQRSMQGAMSDQEVQALLAQPFDIESIEAMGPDGLPLGARFVIFPTRSQIELAAEEPDASAAPVASEGPPTVTGESRRWPIALRARRAWARGRGRVSPPPAGQDPAHAFYRRRTGPGCRRWPRG